MVEEEEAVDRHLYLNEMRSEGRILNQQFRDYFNKRLWAKRILIWNKRVRAAVMAVPAFLVSAGLRVWFGSDRRHV